MLVAGRVLGNKTKVLMDSSREHDNFCEKAIAIITIDVVDAMPKNFV